MRIQTSELELSSDRRPILFIQRTYYCFYASVLALPFIPSES
ncbi:hypothetical protein PIIN_11271 [Serendipita indica DSM 11827]|uniref:Uncharacterized protein n=1 Tax=Serendipita indica (strain DSM 11827) TaxID=1109443 RepID=G4U150_SERID|nr:hypothetical protein PIIN_11271 [Serendipita indica DSM 11827]